MEDEKRVFLAYRAIFDGNNAQIRQSKAILKVVSQHRKSSQSILKDLGEQHVLCTLKKLLERKIFQSEVKAKLAFPDLFTTSLAQDVQHNASEADAARTEAEALEDIASLEGDRDGMLEKTIEEASSTDPHPNSETQYLSLLIIIHYLTVSTAVPVQRTADGIKIPSLYPLYIPYKIQHLVLARTQRLLEECCYNFTAQWMPELLEQRNWDCSEAIELNKWTFVVVKRLGKLPSHCFGTFDDPETPLVDVLISINKLRHSAVHRLSTTAKGISELIRSTARFAAALRDPSCKEQLNELHNELEGKIRALELNKNFLETELEHELEDIAKRRRELDEKEKEAVATMLREDKEYGSLIGVLLSQTVEQIFDKNKAEESGHTNTARSLDHETEEEHEQEMNIYDDARYKVGNDVSIEVDARTNHEFNLDTRESVSEHQFLFEARQGFSPSLGTDEDKHYEQHSKSPRDLPNISVISEGPSSPSPSPPQLGPGRESLSLTPPMNPESDTEPRTSRLTTIEDINGPGTFCVLQIRENGRVDGRLVVDENDISFKTAMLDAFNDFEKGSR